MSDMSWREFRELLSGIGEKTVLGRIVSIRTEKDPEVIKNFGPHEREIRRKWQTKQAGSMSAEKEAAGVEAIKQAFLSMGGVKHAGK